MYLVLLVEFGKDLDFILDFGFGFLIMRFEVEFEFVTCFGWAWDCHGLGQLCCWLGLVMSYVFDFQTDIGFEFGLF